MRYSDQTGCFYPTSENYALLPDDITDVPHEDFALAMSRQPGESVDLVNGRIVIVPTPEPTLVELKAAKASAIKSDCSATITAGIDHDALGTVHHYPTAATDQDNLNGLITKSLISGAAGEPYKFWCADSTGVWARRDHTAAQIQSLGLAVAAQVIAAQDLYEIKLAAIQAATTPAELDAVSW